MSHYNPKTIEDFLSLLGHVDAGGCTEVRIFPKSQCRGSRTINGERVYIGKTASGYYDDYSQLANDIAFFDGKADIYITLNPVKRDFLARAYNRLEYAAENTTADADILADLWFPFDLDPSRPAKISSTSEELELAKKRSDAVCQFFKSIGITPLSGMSGNGYHGLIRLIGYPNTEETARKKERLTKFLAEKFSHDGVKYDATVFNMARIWKLYGVMAVKGDDMPERPHRRASIEIPDELPEPVDLYAMIDEIIPKDSNPAEKNSRATTRQTVSPNSDYPLLNVEKYLEHYGYAFKVKPKAGRTIYELDQCPFNPDHNRGEVCITQEADGKLGFKCFHNSCSDKTWQHAKEVIGDPKLFFTQKASSQNGSGKAHNKGNDNGWGTIDAPGHLHYERTTNNEQQATNTRVKIEEEKKRLINRVKRLRQQNTRKLDIIKTLLDDNKLSLDESAIREIVETIAPKLKPTSAREIMETEYPDPIFFIDGILTEGLSLLVSPPKGGKSWLGLDWSVAIAMGGLAMGKIPVPQHQVAYAALEDNKRRIKGRLKTLLPDGSVPDGLHFFTLGEIPKLDANGLDLLEEYLDENPEVKLVFVDTWARVKPQTGKRQSIYDEDYEVLAPLQQIALDRQISVCLIYHTRKNEDPNNILNEISGSTGIQGVMDGIIMLKSKSTHSVLHVTGRDIEQQDFALTFSGGHWTFEGNAEAFKLTEQQKAVIELLRNAKDYDEPMTPKNIAAILQWKPNNAKQILNTMRKNQMVISDNGIYQLADHWLNQKVDNPDNRDNRGVEDVEITPVSEDSFGYSREISLNNPDNRITDGEAPGYSGYLFDDSPDNREKSNGDKDPDEPVIPVIPVIPQRSSHESEEFCQRQFIKRAFEEFGQNAIKVEKLIRHAQAAGYDLTEGNRSPREGINRIVAHMAGKELEGLQFRSVGDGLYTIATVQNGRVKIRL